MNSFNLPTDSNMENKNTEKNTIAPRKPLSRQQQWVRGFILVFGTFVFVCFLAADPLLRHFRKSDFRNAQPQIGVATIAMIVPPEAHFVGALKQEDGGFVNVRFQGGLYKVNTVHQFAQLHEGKPAQIVYRVGSRGDVVVDQASPLSAPPINESAAP